MVIVVIGTAADWVMGRTGELAAAGDEAAAAHSEHMTVLVEVVVMVEILGAWRTVVLPAAVTV